MSTKNGIITELHKAKVKGDIKFLSAPPKVDHKLELYSSVRLAVSTTEYTDTGVIISKETHNKSINW
jgi:hypothetical protein